MATPHAKKTNRLVPVAIAVLCLAALVAGTLVLGEEAAAPPVTLEGVVVDAHCYLTRGAAGPDHAGCANACIARGVPAAFLASDGTLYLLLGKTPHSVKEQVRDLAAVPVKLTAVRADRGGVRALQVQSIERVEK